MQVSCVTFGVLPVSVFDVASALDVTLVRPLRFADSLELCVGSACSFISCQSPPGVLICWLSGGCDMRGCVQISLISSCLFDTPAGSLSDVMYISPR